LVQSGKKAVSKFELPETQFKRTERQKSPVKITWSKKMTILSTFLESSSNFLFNHLEKILQNLVQSGKKAVSKFELPKSQFESTVRDKIICKIHLK